MSLRSEYDEKLSVLVRSGVREQLEEIARRKGTSLSVEIRAALAAHVKTEAATPGPDMRLVS